MSQVLIQTKPSAEHGRQRPTDIWRAISICILLVMAIAIVYGQTLSYGFSTLDDSFFVHDEPNVKSGITWSGIVWAFTNGPLGEWYPLAMLSHMLDCQLFGLRPAGHHFTNLLLHAATTVALFLVLWRMTEGLWPSALVAALFAIHPLHVESVAWISERRDVLSGLFFMLTLGAYGEYVRRPLSLGRYLAVVGFFALGLMAKPMLVTLPGVLLLLDFWPLGRFRQSPPDTAAPNVRREAGRNAPPAPFPWRILVEKIPLIAMAVAVAGLTMLTHSKRPDEPLTMLERLANAAISYVAYLGQLFVPVGLSTFYSHPEAGRPVWQVAAAVALLLAITLAALIGRRVYPYFFVGWFWYVGMLVPVLGLTFVGAHARADRYTYLTQIGLYIALVWGAMQLGAAWPARRWVFGIASGAMLIVLMACAWRQTGYWQDDRTLWEHALACDPKNATAKYIVGSILEKTDENGAAARYQQALELDPDESNVYNVIRAKAHNGLGNIAARKGDLAGAIAHCKQALESDPYFVAAEMNLAGFLAKNGDIDEAMTHFYRTIELSPESAHGYWNLAMALSQQDKTDEAIENFEKALEIDPSLGMAHMHLAILLAKRDEINGAIIHFRRAIELDPDVALSYYQMAELLRKQGKTSEANKYQDRGVKASHRYAEAQNKRGTELAEEEKLDEAIAQFEIAIAVLPDFAEAHCNLADALALQGDFEGANSHYRRALQINPNLESAKLGLRRLNQ